MASAALLVMYAVCVAVVLSQNNPTVASDVVGRFDAWLSGHNAPAALTGVGRVEFLLNAAMFAPITLLAAISLPRHPWANWVVYAFVVSGVVELLQGLYLPPRSAQFVDVVANTLGALVGALMAAPVTRRLVAASHRRRGAEGAAD